MFSAKIEQIDRLDKTVAIMSRRMSEQGFPLEPCPDRDEYIRLPTDDIDDKYENWSDEVHREWNDDEVGYEPDF